MKLGLPFSPEKKLRDVKYRFSTIGPLGFRLAGIKAPPHAYKNTDYCLMLTPKTVIDELRRFFEIVPSPRLFTRRL